MGRMIGIDLGTSNSVVAVLEGGVPLVIPNQEGFRSTPSVVAFTGSGEPLVGEIARRQTLTNPRDTAFAVKRLIGRKFDSPECEQARRFMPYPIVEAANGDAHIRIGDELRSPTEISALVLAKLRSAAEDYLEEAVEEAVIAVPAYFNDPQRQATRDAGLIAGLKVSRILNESTAAALAYDLKNAGGDGQYVAVYDLGGGTFDITILEMAEGLYQVRATGGNTFLGGEDFDERIMSWLLTEFLRETGVHLGADGAALHRVREAAEKAKRELSSAEQAEIALPFLITGASGTRSLNRVLTRRQYEVLTEDLLEQTIETCCRCLADSQLRPEQINEVLLVGGQSHAPRVAEIVRSIFCREPNRTVHPDEGVAMGAAIQTGIIHGEIKDLVLLDVTPHTLGIETRDGSFTPLIERNRTIPTYTSRLFTTVADDQTRVEVHVLQGESELAAYNRSLARFELTDIAPAPTGKPQVEVGFWIDLNGLVSVEATDQATGRRQAMTIRPSGGLSQADLDRRVAAASARNSKQNAGKELLAVVRRLDGLVTNTTRAVKVLEDKLTPDEQQRIADWIQRAKAARSGANLDDLKARLAEMEKAAGIIGQAVLRP